jgi:hypothetical protein
MWIKHKSDLFKLENIIQVSKGKNFEIFVLDISQDDDCELAIFKFKNEGDQGKVFELIEKYRGDSSFLLNIDCDDKS